MKIKEIEKVNKDLCQFSNSILKQRIVKRISLKRLNFIFFLNFSFLHGKIILLLLDFSNIMSNLLISNLLING
jgi:cysteine sulfinate desulfinase/cysteine desulfurase-like protein